MVTWWPVTTDSYLESDQSNSITKIQTQFRDSEASSSELSGTNINPKNNFKLMMINYTGLSVVVVWSLSEYF